MVCEPMSETAKKARRLYHRRMAVAGALYVGLVFAGALAVRGASPPQWAAVILALLPTAPALLMLRAFLAYVSALEEFQRRMQTKAVIVAAGLVVFGSFSYGFLEEWADFPRVPLFWVFPVFCVVFGLAHFVIRRRYQ